MHFRITKKGYSVKGSLRNLDREDEVRSSIKKEVADDNLEFCKLNLLSDDGWEDAMQGCDYLLHMASPFITYEPKNEDDLIRPAKEGTLRALKFAKDAGVKKVVLTSSVAAIAYGHEKTICGQVIGQILIKILVLILKVKLLLNELLGIL